MGPSLAPAMAESNPVTFVGFMPPLPAGLASAAPGSQSVVAGAAAAERNAARPGAARMSRRDGPGSSLFLEDALTATLEMRRGFDEDGDANRADLFRSAGATRTLAGTSAALEVSANIVSARGVG